MKERAGLIFRKSAEYMKHRKIQLIAAVIAAGFLLFLYAGNWMLEEEPVTSYITGLYGWVPEISGTEAAFVQEFTPGYAYVEKIGVCFRDTEYASPDGTVSFSVSDSEGEILFYQEVSCGELENSYYYYDVNLKLNKNKIYTITVTLNLAWPGSPSLLLSTTEEYLEENISLTFDGSVLEGQQLATSYVYRTVYENASTQANIIKSGALILCILLIIAVGCPLEPKYRKVLAYILLLLGPYVLGRRLELLSTTTETLVENAMAWNIGLMYLFELCLWLILRNPGIAAAVSNFLLTLLYSVNYFVVLYRGVSFRFSDLQAVGTFATVAENYSIEPDKHLAMAWLIALLFVVSGFAVSAWNRKWNPACRVGGVLLAAFSFFVLAETDFLTDQGFVRIEGLQEQLTYEWNGYLVTTFMNIGVTGMEKPAGYSASIAEDVLAGYEDEVLLSEEEQEDLPNIILVMNESFSDLRVLGNLELSGENLSFFYSLSENTIRGYVNASVLGGGTANSEFEVFTGCTMGFISTSYYPYFHCFYSEKESLVTQLQQYGYQTYSMHPQLASNWNRNSVYPNIGFETSCWFDDFEDAETIHMGVSDLETYYKIEEIFENKDSDDRLFVFDLTMQNHGSYLSDSLEPTVTATNVSSDEADLYLSLIQISDEAFQQLVEYFTDYEEKVIICMFGDHQPLFYDDSFYEAVYADTEGLTEEEKTWNQYKTPFVIWANYDIEEASDLDISMNYLGVLLMETAGVPLSSTFQYLSDLMEEYPIITANGYVDSEGNIYSWSSDHTEFTDYRMIQYQYLFD